jgi:hypothetical protein
MENLWNAVGDGGEEEAGVAAFVTIGIKTSIGAEVKGL